MVDFLVVQPRIHVPPEILKGIARGDLYRVGSVVRETANGRIFKLLSEVPKERESEQVVKAAAKGAGSLTKAVDFKDPRMIVGAIIVGTVAAGGILCFATRKRKESDIPELPEWIRDYNAAWAAYLEAIQIGAMGTGIIDRLIDALDALKHHENDGTVGLYFSTEQAGQLVDLVVRYTTELAEANSVELDEMQRPDSDLASVVHIRRYLEAQRKIFGDAA
jgi:hypothetical protein